MFVSRDVVVATTNGVVNTEPVPGQCGLTLYMSRAVHCLPTTKRPEENMIHEARPTQASTPSSLYFTPFGSDNLEAPQCR
jgi:hypothetical protein